MTEKPEKPEKPAKPAKPAKQRGPDENRALALLSSEKDPGRRVELAQSLVHYVKRDIETYQEILGQYDLIEEENRKLEARVSSLIHILYGILHRSTSHQSPEELESWVAEIGWDLDRFEAEEKEREKKEIKT